MWIILFNAVDDFGVRELNEVHRSGAHMSVSYTNPEIEQTKQQIMKETLHGALRISGLVRTATSVLRVSLMYTSGRRPGLQRISR